MHVNLGENLLNNLLQQVDLSWSVKFQLWVTDREIPEKWWLNISSNFPFFFIQPSGGFFFPMTQLSGHDKRKKTDILIMLENKKKAI